MVGHQKREIGNSESNRHQVIDVLFDEQKDTQNTDFDKNGQLFNNA